MKRNNYLNLAIVLLCTLFSVSACSSSDPGYLSESVEDTTTAVEPAVEPTVEPAVEAVVEPTAEPTAEPAVEPTVEKATFTGTWDSPEWGVVKLTQDGNQVWGTYEYLTEDNFIVYGHIRGTIEGNTLNHQWWQSFEQNTSYDQSETRGAAYFILSSDGNAIQGEWRGENDEAWLANWNLTRE